MYYVEYLTLPSRDYKTMARFIATEQSFLKNTTVSHLAGKIPIFMKYEISLSHLHESATETYTEASESPSLPHFLLLPDPF
jgi:hypothetical protein